MAGTGRDMANLSDEEESRKAMYEFDGKGRITASSGPEETVYAVDMSFDELFDQDQAQVGKVTGVVHLETPDGDEIGRYQMFEHRPSTEPSDVHRPAVSEDSENSEYGRLLGKRGVTYEDLTEYAAEDALEELDRVSGELGDMTDSRDIPDF
jgi:hypothetical protein